MKIFKFGGASVRNAEAVVNATEIVRSVSHQNVVIVVSAMGKMTNALEEIVKSYRDGNEDLFEKVEAFYLYHTGIVRGLKIPNGTLDEKLKSMLSRLNERLAVAPSDNFDYDYDQIVSYGELFSSTILSDYMQMAGVTNFWMDARTLVRTDNNYREGKVNWEKSTELISNAWNQIQQAPGEKRRIMVTQGFIGHTAERNTTTLGREGSDFSAAIFAFALDAESVTIWKDVPGMLNADPKYFSDAVKLKRISYKEAIELAYYGASVIHPKTIKPLQNKKIVLHVRSFKAPAEEGTVIESSTFSDSLIPSYIFKMEQALISITPRDFSFIVEENLRELFGIFMDAKMRINLMQNSAINFSVCVDYDADKLTAIRNACSEKYEVLYNQPCELVTIRHYDQETISRLLIGKKVLVEQRSRSTARFVLVNS